MVIASFGLLLIGPSALTGLALSRRWGRVATFLSMMAIFTATVLFVWLSLTPLFTSSEGIALLVAQVLVSFGISGFKLPAMHRSYSSSPR